MRKHKLSILNPYRLTTVLLLAFAAIAVACGGTEVVTEKVVQTVVVEKEVVKEVEKIKEVEVEKVVIQEKEVPVDKVVTKEVVTKYTPKEGEEKASGTAATGEVAYTRQVLDKSKHPTSYGESPDLAAKVKSGDLPPVEERLPNHPMVLDSSDLDGVGKYGGTWKRAFTGPADEQNIERISKNHMIFWNSLMTELRPHIAEDFESNADATKFTFHLREGMKWSDGEPFTTADVMFWYDHILNDDNVLPAKPGYSKTANGEMGVWEAVDDYTYTVTFSEPYGVYLELVSGLSVAGHLTQFPVCGGGFSPKHYMSQFHAEFVGEDAANKLAKDAGYDNWGTHFCAKNNPVKNVDSPVTTAWMPVKGFNEEESVWERNPYYWAVDAEGNQLPYLDKIVLSLAEDVEVLGLRVVAGEFDIQGRHVKPDKLPLLRENEDKGGYRVQFTSAAGSNAIAIYPNQDYAAHGDGDKEIGDLLREADFRRALSIGFDREQIREAIFLGMGRTASACAMPDEPYAPGEEYDQIWSTLDVAKANELLDGLGLDMGSDGFRTKPSGDPLVLDVIAVTGAFTDSVGAAELVKKDWADNIGINLKITPTERSLRETRLKNNEAMLSMWGGGGASEPLFLFPNHDLAFNWESGMGPASGQWFQDSSVYGPPLSASIAKQQELWRQGAALPRSERIDIGKEIRKIACEEVHAITTITGTPAWIFVIKDYVRNFPSGVPFTTVGQTPGSFYTEAFWFDQ